jgi:hypothetical protein
LKHNNSSVIQSVNRFRQSHCRRRKTVRNRKKKVKERKGMMMKIEEESKVKEYKNSCIR